MSSQNHVRPHSLSTVPEHVKPHFVRCKLTIWHHGSVKTRRLWKAQSESLTAILYHFISFHHTQLSNCLQISSTEQRSDYHVCRDHPDAKRRLRRLCSDTSGQATPKTSCHSWFRYYICSPPALTIVPFNLHKQKQCRRENSNSTSTTMFRTCFKLIFLSTASVLPSHYQLRLGCNAAAYHLVLATTSSTSAIVRGSCLCMGDWFVISIGQKAL